jgi:hypothetical protein
MKCGNCPYEIEDSILICPERACGECIAAASLEMARDEIEGEQ